MARLPTPGSDKNTWGDILNDFLSQAHKGDGSLKDNAVSTAAIQDGTVTSAKLDSAVQDSIDAAVSDITLDKQWAIAGPINVAAAEVDYISPAYITVPSGYTAAITAVRARINSGTNVQLHVTRNGATVGAIGTVTATTAGASSTGLNIALTDGDLVAPVVDSTSGAPQNMTFMITYMLTKA
jgi:hypothetical protein